jgi:hypothetical protein
MVFPYVSHPTLGPLLNFLGCPRHAHSTGLTLEVARHSVATGSAVYDTLVKPESAPTTDNRGSISFGLKPALLVPPKSRTLSPRLTIVTGFDGLGWFFFQSTRVAR